MTDTEDKALNPRFERLGYKDQVLDIINSLHPMTYKIIVETSHKIFTRIKIMN